LSSFASIRGYEHVTVIPNIGGVLHSVLVQSGGAARRVRHAQGSHLVLVWRPGVLYRRRVAANISANLAMDVICEAAAAAVAAVRGGIPARGLVGGNPEGI
jgi:hypothetical protein